MAAFQGQLISHLARRGMDSMSGDLPKMSMEMDRDDLMQVQQQQWNDVFNQLPIWGIVMIGITVLVFYILIVSVSYTLGRVVMTLAMIETPTVDYIPISSLDSFDPTSKDATNLIIDGEPHTVMANKPITSKIRSTIRHLHKHAGFWSRWRGLGYFFLYSFAFGAVHFPIMSALRWLPAGETFAAILTSVLLAQLHCAWTHKMISMPSQKSFLSRIPPRAAWRQLWIPNAVAAGCMQASFQVIRMLALTLSYTIYDHEKQQIVDSWWIIVMKILAVLSLAFFLGFFIVLPNYAALTRIEATLLNDEEDTIVPFDRTFGGKVTPVVVGGSGFHYVKEVCQTFDREARIRIIKLFFKMALIFFALTILYIHVVSFEMFFIIGPVAKEAAKKAGARLLRM
ncbi:hypothetical protein NA57DRAFT_75029 [Rhizodiscina lignyota]|uniref:Uncharacterized protein n=1 Tax=Rhizodiscina lignyota TaxID=1504668 RepID=A0A9P4IHW8_9PEZI|nr:hypothetical protein NA57DRAFT_75029 [Rhizodiscina lignyota]